MWRAGLQRLGLALGALALVCLCLEGGTRALGLHFSALTRPGQGDRGLWVYDASKGWALAPRSTGARYLGGPDPGLIHVNSLGLRGDEWPVAKRDGIPRVLVFGDSFVFGVGVDEEHVFTTQLQESLTRRSGNPVEVWNAGVIGYSTDQEYILFQELGPRFQPDVVLLVTCDNDFEGNTEDFVWGRYYKPYFDLAADGELHRRNVPTPVLDGAQRVKLWLGQHSNLWNLFRSRRSSVPVVQRGLDWFQIALPHTSGDALELTSALMLAFRDLAERLGAAFLTVNTAHRGEKTTLYHALRPRLDAAHVPYTALEGALGGARDRHPENAWDFADDKHWNVAAHRLAAEVLAPHVERALALRAGPH